MSLDPIFELKQLVNKSNRNVHDSEWVEKELRAIHLLGMSSHYLDLVKSGVKQTNPNNSSVGYLVGITDIAPNDAPTNLRVERTRVSMPDIDIDTDGRDWLVDYSKRKYGSDKVAQISTFARVKPRSAIRDATRVLGYEATDGDRIAKMVPPDVLGVSKPMSEIMTSSDIRKAYETEPTSKHILDTAKGLEGLIRQPGIHAAGVLITPTSITDYCPVRTVKRGEEQIVATQYDMYEVEEMGLLKMDFLGLRNLTVIDQCEKRVKETYGIDLDYESDWFSDEKTYRMLQSGNSIGVFQVEGKGMQQMLVELQPDSIYDLMAMIALYRPGPLGSGMHTMYIDRKRGRAKVEYPHPLLEQALEKSLGIMLYQEDVLKVMTILAGWSVTESDSLRRAIGKKIHSKVAAARSMFVEGCKKTNGVSDSLANKIFSDIEYFAGYGFNRSHAAAYGITSYITAYLKANYPTEYMASLLSSVVSAPDKMTQYLRECRRMGIEVKTPSIAHSKADFTVESEGVIRFGFNGITSIGEVVAESLVKAGREYSGIHEFVRSVDHSVLNTGVLESLISSGALDELSPKVERQLLTTEEKLEHLMREKKALGVFVTEHPLEGIIDTIGSECTSTIADLVGKINGEVVRVGGIIVSKSVKTTRAGRKMCTLTFEDMTGDIDVVVFPRDFESWGDKFEVGSIVVIEARLSKEEIQRDEGDDAPEVLVRLMFSGMETPDLPEVSGKPITINLTKAPSYDILKSMNKVIDANPGDSPVIVSFIDGGREISLRFMKTCNFEIQNDIKQIGVLDIVNI